MDTGGPSRECWWLLAHAMESKYCQGAEGRKVFDRNTPALRVIYTSRYCFVRCFIGLITSCSARSLK